MLTLCHILSSVEGLGKYIHSCILIKQPELNQLEFKLRFCIYSIYNKLIQLKNPVTFIENKWKT